eukprot:11529439-Ditylum_brightwellii.AAC.1
MPGFVPKSLKKFQHATPVKPQYAPHKWNQPKYGQKVQYAPPPDTSDVQGKKDTLKIQAIVGTFLYYGRAINGTILSTINEISADQAKPKISTAKQSTMLMDYLATYPNAVLRFFAGNMQLHVDSDAAYLVINGTKSRITGYFYCASSPHALNYNKTPHNAPILIEFRTLKHVVCSVAEAECGALFYNSQTTMGLRNLLETIVHPQQPTKINTNNKTTNSFVHAFMRIKRSKSWDMQWHWLCKATTRKALEIF